MIDPSARSMPASGYPRGQFASIGMIDAEHARDGVELTLVWGEPDGGTSKPGVERHIQAEIRVTVGTTPLH